MEEDYPADFTVSADPLYPVDRELLGAARSLGLVELRGGLGGERVAELAEMQGDFEVVEKLSISRCQLEVGSWETLRGFADFHSSELRTVEISSLDWNLAAAVPGFLNSRLKHDGSGDYREAVSGFFEKLESMSARNEGLIRGHGERVWRVWQEVVLMLRKLKNLKQLAIRKSHLNMLGKWDIDRSLETTLPSVDEAVSEYPEWKFPEIPIFPIFHGLDVLADQVRLSCLHTLVSVELPSNNLFDPALVRLVQTLSQSRSLETLNFSDNFISDCGYIFTFYCLPERLTVLDFSHNQILMKHPKFPTTSSPRLSVWLQGNPGYLDDSNSSQDASASSCFGDVPPVLLSPPMGVPGSMDMDVSQAAGLELLRHLYEASDDDEDEDDDSDYVSSDDSDPLSSSHSNSSSSS